MLLLDGKDEEQRDQFLQELYDDGSAEATALDQLRAHMEERGLKWEADGNGAVPGEDHPE